MDSRGFFSHFALLKGLQNPRWLAVLGDVSKPISSFFWFKLSSKSWLLEFSGLWAWSLGWYRNDLFRVSVAISVLKNCFCKITSGVKDFVNWELESYAGVCDPCRLLQALAPLVSCCSVNDHPDKHACLESFLHSCDLTTWKGYSW